MKRTFLFILICLLVNISYSQTYTFTFTASDFSIVENNGEHTITAPIDFINTEKTFDPILPSCVKRVLLPPNKRVSSFTITYSQHNWLNNIVLKGTPMSYPTDGNHYPHVHYAYALKTYPDSIVRYKGLSTIDHYPFASFIITPFVYDATSGALSFVNQINISLELEDDTIKRIAPNNSSLIKHLVHNYQDINSFYPQKMRRSATQNIDYLIITADSLKSSFEPLRIWKTQKGVYTKIITIEEIDSIYANIWNTQSLRIKECIKHYRDSYNIEWVLLGGDETVVPIVKAYMEILELTIEGDTIQFRKDTIPSDLFYSCFDDYSAFDWNANGNDLIGELEDNIGMEPSVSLSRLPIRTKQHIETYVEKLLHYEKEPAITTASMLICAQQIATIDSVTGHSDAQILNDTLINWHIAPHWNGTVMRFYDTYTDFPDGADYDLTKANLTTQLNTNNYNLMHFTAHGNSTFWEIELDERFYVDDVNNLTNTNPLIILTSACHTNAFDLAEPCLSESFIRKLGGGAIAYWGSSRYGWNGYSEDLNGYFFANLFLNTSHNFATLVQTIKLNNVSWASVVCFYRWLLFSNNAIGDAEVPIYTTIPNKFENVTIEDNGTTLTVNTGGIDSCTITISNVAHGGNYYVTDTTVNSATFTNVPNDYTIVVTKDNYIPYIYDPNAPQPICHITNEIINDELVVMGCEETKIGGQPRIDIEIQTRGVDSGVLVPIDSLPLIPFLRGEVKITDTGSLEVINGGTVNIEHLTMEDGAELNIH